MPIIYVRSFGPEGQQDGVVRLLAASNTEVNAKDKIGQSVSHSGEFKLLYVKAQAVRFLGDFRKVF